MRSYWRKKLPEFPRPEVLDEDGEGVVLPDPDTDATSWKQWGALPEQHMSLYIQDKKVYASIHKHIEAWCADTPRGQRLPCYSDVPVDLHSETSAALGLAGWLKTIIQTR